MAIVEMTKLSVITRPENKEKVLTLLQKLNNVEAIDLPKALIEEKFNVKRQKVGSKNREDFYRAEKALLILSQYEKKLSTIQKLKSRRPEMKLEELISQLNEEEVQDKIQNVLFWNDERQRLQDEQTQVSAKMDDLALWRQIPYSSEDLKNLHDLNVYIGTIPNDSNHTDYEALKKEDLFIDEISSDRDEQAVIIAFAQGKIEESLLEDHHFRSIQWNIDRSPQEAYQNLEKKRQELIEEEKKVVRSLQQANDFRESIQQASEVFYAKWQQDKVKEFSYTSQALTVVSGWIPVKALTQVQEEIQQVIEDKDYALWTEEPEFKEIEENEVPVKLENKGLIRPFELITEMYGLPRYGELDPTPFLTPFYMVFFGMMMGDFGYGLVLFIGTFLALKFLDLAKGMRRAVSFAFYLSFPTMIIGLIYGSMFGASLPFSLINPTAQAMELMMISMGIGVANIFIALILKVYIEKKRGNKESMYSDGIGWLLILGGILMMVGASQFGLTLISEIAKWVAILAAVGMLVVPMLANRNKAVGLAAGAYNLYGISGYIGDVISYSRLMAIGISGGSIAMAFNMLIGMIPPVGRFTVGVVLIVFLQGFNMFLSLLSAYVHGLRLTFVEFFGKFYDADGRAFAPIKTLEKYVKLIK